MTIPGDTRYRLELPHGCEDVLAGQIGFESGSEAQRVMAVQQLDMFDAWVEGGPDIGLLPRSEFAGNGKPVEHAADRLDAHEQPDRVFEVAGS